MLKYLLLFLIFCPILSNYQSLNKYYGFDKIKDKKDKICSITYASVNYVKPCEEGKYCQDLGGISHCIDIKKTTSRRTLGQSCSITSECEPGLYCDNTCKNYCTGNLKEFINKSGRNDCKNTNIPEGLYYYNEFDNNDNPKAGSEIRNSIDIFRVGGKIHFHKQQEATNSYHYYEEKKELAYIGTVEDNNFVADPLACSSGYALKFYPDGNLKDPSTFNSNEQYYNCVTVKEVIFDKNDNDKCFIKYGNNDEIYYEPETECHEYLLKQLELFKKYTEVYTVDKQKACDKSENYNEPLTCNDDEIRKWYYFYKHPLDYLLYYNEKDDKGNDITTYLIQQKYNSYQSGSILNIKYIMILLFLLSL